VVMTWSCDMWVSSALLSWPHRAFRNALETDRSLRPKDDKERRRTTDISPAIPTSVNRA
jgi:hypothetical protein